jgi:hypothetical protein
VIGLAAAGGAAFLLLSDRSSPPLPPEPPVTLTPTPNASPTPTSAPAKPSPTAKAQPTPTSTPEPTMGTLVFESDVPDTSVFIDRRYLGKAPLTAPDIAPGEHQINLSPAGYDPHVETITVVPGTRTISVSFKEVRLNVSTPAIHKHAIGSCSGTLRATPQGLTYDTTNASDAFTVPLTNLETFTADYIARNLRVKIKNGKSYNFADPDGNIERLNVFYQQVEKVRQRLLGGK